MGGDCVTGGDIIVGDSDCVVPLLFTHHYCSVLPQPSQMLDTSVSTPPNCVADDELIHRAQVRPSADLQQKLVVLHAVDAQCADDNRS